MRVGRRSGRTVLAAAVALAAAACTTGGGAGAGSALREQSPPSTPSEPERAEFPNDYARTCGLGVGYAGAPAYRRSGRGVHRAVLLVKGIAAKRWSYQDPSDYPAGWLVGADDDVTKAELVVCYERIAASPAGKTCLMEDHNHHRFTMAMYNTQYRLQVREARTGKAVFSKVGRTSSTECPVLALTYGDRRKYYTDLDPADYRDVIKPYLAGG